MATINVKNLDFGKILVLYAGHDMTLQDIKDQTLAISVNELKLHRRTSEKNFYLAYMLGQFLKTIDVYGDIDIYFIKGRKATSINLALKGDYLIGAYILKTSEVLACKDAAYFASRIDFVRERLHEANFHHTEFLSDIQGSNNHAAVNSYTADLANMVNNYCASEYAACRDIVRNTLTNRW